MQKAIYKKIKTKAINGPGGARCSCCRSGSKGQACKKHNRILRRTKKLDKLLE